MTTPQRPPKDDLFRAMPGGMSSEDGKTLTIRLAPPESWAEIDSISEGHFLERFKRGAYRKTLAESKPKILFQHGKDPQIGEKVIASTDEVGEDELGPFARGQILDGVPPLVVDGLRKNVYGASHRFSVVREDWDPKPAGGPHNPKKLPERTITEARLYELGPVTWPAYAQASASLRSLTDEFRVGEIAAAPERLREIATYIGPDAPSVDAGASPHLEPERREAVAPPTTAARKEPSVDISMYVTRDEMSARRRELDAELTRMAAIPGVLDQTTQDDWDAKAEERTALDAAIKAWDDRLKFVTTLAPANEERFNVPNIVVKPSETDIYDPASWQREISPERRDQKLRDNAMRSVEQARFPHERADQDGARDWIAHLLDDVDSEDKEIAKRILATGSPAYKRDFNRWLKSGGLERGTALAVGVDGTGGFAVPYVQDPTVVATGAHTSIVPYRAACRVVTIAGTDTWQALTANAVTAAYALEAAAATEQGPTFTRPEFIVKRAHAYVSSSLEFAQDRPDLGSELANLFQEAKDTLEEAQFTIGTGATVYPQGIGLKDAFTRVDSVGNDVVAVADVLAMEAALPIRHRINSAWFLSRAAIRAIQAFETTGGQLFNGVGYPAVGNPVVSSTGNTGLTLLGRPVWETPSMPWTPTTDDTTWGVLMDPRNYVIVDRVGMSLRVYDQVMDGATPSMPTGQVGFYAFWRNTARVLNVDGGRQGAVQ